MKTRSCRGFSLIEMLISTTILALIAGAVTTVILQSQSSFVSQNSKAQTVQQMRIAMDQISRYLRQAGSDPTGSLTLPPVQVLDAGYIQINSDITGSVPSITGNDMESTGDPDGTLGSICEQVRIRHDTQSRNLLIDIGYGEEVLCPGITAFTLSFFDSSGNPTTDPTQIARVRIEMTAQTAERDLQTQAYETVTLSTDVYLRSRTPNVLP